MKLFKIVTLNLLILFFLILTVEIASYFYLKTSTNKGHRLKILPKEELLELIRDPQYEPPFPLGRETKNDSNSPNFNLHFYGCSFTYGVKLPESSTFPYYISRSINQSNYYNHGIPGHGPASNLHNFNGHRVHSHENTKNIGIFLFFEDHINRANLNFSHTYHTSPNQLVTVNENLQTRPLLESNFSKYVSILLLQSSYTFKVIYQNFSKSIDSGLSIPDKRQVTKTVRILKEIKSKFTTTYKNSVFYIFEIHDSTSYRKYFESEGLEIIDLNISSDQSLRLPDMHFNAKGNKIIAKRIIEKITEFNQAN